VVVYEDEDQARTRAWRDARIATAMRKIRPEVHVTFADGPEEALRSAVELAAGAPVLFLYEKLDPALAALESLGATPWPEEDLMGDLAGEPLADDGLPSELIRAAESYTMQLPGADSLAANLAEPGERERPG
jgi:hypothetical protein